MNLFKKKVGPIKIWWLLLIGIIALIGVIIGSFLDLNISKAIAKENSTFGKLVEAYGPVIGCIIAPTSAAILTKKIFVKDNKRLYWVLGIIFVILMLIIPAFVASDYATGQSGYAWHYNRFIGFSWLLVLYTGIYFLTLHFVDDSLPTIDLVRNGLYMLVGFIVAVVVVNTILKGLIYRPRYRAMAWANPKEGTEALGFSYYQNWWSFAFWKKPEWFLEMNIPKDYIKSWPSGHTTTATGLLLLPFLTSVLKVRNNKINIIVFIVSSIQVLIVALGRMIAGAHFLSDVSSAVLISLCLLFLPCLLVDIILKRIYKVKSE